MVPIHAECEAACGALYARAEKSKNAKDGGADRR